MFLFDASFLSWRGIFFCTLYFTSLFRLHIGTFCMRMCAICRYSCHMIRYPAFISPDMYSQNRFSVFRITFPLSISWNETILFSASIHADFSFSPIFFPSFTSYRSAVYRARKMRPCPNGHSRVNLYIESCLIIQLRSIFQIEFKIPTFRTSCGMNLSKVVLKYTWLCDF